MFIHLNIFYTHERNEGRDSVVVQLVKLLTTIDIFEGSSWKE